MKEVNSIKKERVSSLLKDTISVFLSQVSNRKTFITVSHIEPKSIKTINVICSVFPDEGKKEVEEFLKRKEEDCRKFIRKNTSLKTIPFVRFIIK